tara:strand:+ start:6478 stop:7212 length:735 start_codon:yes stop_codon:yes gene_type:complete
MEKKVRGTYKIDVNKTPQENITEILKLMMPVKLTLNKLQFGNGSQREGRRLDGSLNLSGVTIKAVGEHRWASCKEIKDFKRIQFSIRIPGKHWGRDAYRNWSIPVKWILKKEKEKKILSTDYPEDFNGKVSLTHIANVFDELSRLYEEGEEKSNKEKKIEERAKIKLQNLKKDTGMPTEVSLRHSNYGRYSVDNFVDGKEPEYSYSLSINLSQLNEEQVIKMGSLFKEISKIKKGKFTPTASIT